MTLFQKIQPIIICLFFLVPAPVFAANNTDWQTTLVADMDIVDASVQNNRNQQLEINFGLQNGNQLQGDIRLGIKIMKNQEGSEKIIDQWMSGQKLSLNPDEYKSTKITYKLPTYVQGKIDVWVIAVNSNSLPLGNIKAGTIDLPEKKLTLNISEKSCHLAIEGENNNSSQKYSVSEGVVVKREESLQIICQLKNPINQNLNIDPDFSVYYRSLAGEKVNASSLDQPVTLKPSESREVSWNLPPINDLSPQAYEAKLIVSTNQSEVIGGIVPIHFVIAGPSATIQNVSLDKAIFEADETTVARVFWSDSADRVINNRLGIPSQLSDATLSLIIIDQKDGHACSENYQKKLENNLNKIFSFPVSLSSKCVEPIIKSEIVANQTLDNNKILSTLEYQYKQPAKSPDKFAKAKILDYIIYFLVLIVICLIGWLIVKKRYSQLSKLTLWAIIGFGGLFVFYQQAAEAKTYYVQTTYGGEVIGDFAYNFNLDQGIYDQNDSINLSIAVQDLNCVNHSAQTDIQAWLDDAFRTDLDYGYTDSNNQLKNISLGDTVINPNQTTLDDYLSNSTFTASFAENDLSHPFHRIQTKVTLSMSYQPAGATPLNFGPYYSYTGNFDLPFRIKTGGLTTDPSSINLEEENEYNNQPNERKVVINNPDFSAPEFSIQASTKCQGQKPIVKLNWDKVTDAQRYYLTRDELPLGPTKNIWENITAVWYDLTGDDVYDNWAKPYDWDLRLQEISTDFFRYPTSPGYSDIELSSCEATCVDNDQCRNDSDLDGFIDRANYRTRDLNNNSIVDIEDPAYGATTTPDADNDLDNDGILNGDDFDKDNDGINWTVFPGFIDPNGDLDSDSVPNYQEQDVDNDGIPNTFDADNNANGTPDNLEIDQDDDNDGIADWQDVDQDNDGTPNIDDEDSGGGASDPDDDLDDNGRKNYLDYDIDADTFNNNKDLNDDNDGIPDYLDVDDDNDGIADADEIDYDFDLDNDSESNSWDLDLDGDGINNTDDTDSDNDSWADDIDPDDNNDGIADCAATYRVYAHMPVYTYDLNLASETDQTTTYDLDLLFWPSGETLQKHYQFPHYSVPSVDKVTVPLYCNSDLFAYQPVIELSYVIDCESATPSIKLNWTQLQNIESTYIFKDDFGSVSRQILSPVSVDDNELLDMNIDSGNSYSYKVQIKLLNGDIIESEYQIANIQCRPKNPVNLTVSGGCPSCNSSTGTVNISWTQNSNSPTQQTQVEWSTSGSTTIPEKISNTTGLLAQWNFNDALSGTNITTAFNNDGSCGGDCNAILRNMTVASTTGLDGSSSEGWSSDAIYKSSVQTDGVDDYLVVGEEATTNTHSYGTNTNTEQSIGLQTNNLSNQEVVFEWQTFSLSDSGGTNYLESSPNYPSDYDSDLSLENYQIWHPDARMIRVHFDDFVTEEGVDQFNYAGFATDGYSLSGNLGSSFSPAISGDVFNYSFYTDSDNNYKGWLIDYYQASQAPSSSRYPSQYNENQDQWYEIYEPNATEMRVHFADFETEEGYDFVEILDGNDNVQETYSGDLGAFYSEWVGGDRIKVHFVSDGSANFAGFLIDKYEYGRSIRSDNYPQDYLDSTDRWWEINHPGATRIRLNFSDFATEETQDFVELLDKNDNVITTYSGDLGSFTSDWVPGDLVKIHFVADGSNTARGFRISSYDSQQGLSSPNYPDDYEVNDPIYIDGLNVASPNYPANYNDNDDTWQEINPGSNTARIRVHFSVIDIEEGVDYIDLYDAEDNLLRTYNGNTTDEWSDFYDTNQIKVHFVSNDSNTGPGFLIDSYEKIDFTDNGMVWQEKNTTVNSPNYPSYYPANTDQWWEFEDANADGYQLHFSRFNLDGSDSLEIYDGDDNLLTSLNGELGSFWTDLYSGIPKLKIRLLTDGDTNQSGFKIDKYRYYAPKIWTINSVGADYLNLHFADFDVNDDPSCDYVQVLDTSNNVVGTYRGWNMPSFDVVVGGETAKIRMLRQCGGGRGWLLNSYNVLNQQGIYSSNYPYNYDSNTDQTQTITQPGANNISLHFSVFNTFDENDYLQILDNSDNLLAEYSGNLGSFDTPYFLTDTIKLKFITNDSDNDTGWQIDSYRYQTGGGAIMQDIENNDQVTIETMAKIDQMAGGYFPIFARDNFWQFGLDENQGLVFGSESDHTSCAYTPLLHNWQQYAVSYDRSNNQIDFYIDGQTVCSGPADIDLSNTGLMPIYLGRTGWGTDQYAQGKYDYLRVYDRALSKDEIRDIYENNNNTYNWNSEPIDISSPNYPYIWPNSDNTYDWTIQKAGASQIQIHFDEFKWDYDQCGYYEFSSGVGNYPQDRLQIMDASDNVLHTCNVDGCPNVYTVNGDTVKLRLTSVAYIKHEATSYPDNANTANCRLFDEALARRFKIDYYRWTQDSSGWQTINTTNSNSVTWTPPKATLGGQTIYFRAKTCDGQNCAPNYIYATQSFGPCGRPDGLEINPNPVSMMNLGSSAPVTTYVTCGDEYYLDNTGKKYNVPNYFFTGSGGLGNITFDSNLLSCRSNISVGNSNDIRSASSSIVLTDNSGYFFGTNSEEIDLSSPNYPDLVTGWNAGDSVSYTINKPGATRMRVYFDYYVLWPDNVKVNGVDQSTHDGFAPFYSNIVNGSTINITFNATVDREGYFGFHINRVEWDDANSAEGMPPCSGTMTATVNNFEGYGALSGTADVNVLNDNLTLSGNWDCSEYDALYNRQAGKVNLSWNAIEGASGYVVLIPQYDSSYESYYAFSYVDDQLSYSVDLLDSVNRKYIVWAVDDQWRPLATSNIVTVSGTCPTGDNTISYAFADCSDTSNPKVNIVVPGRDTGSSSPLWLEKFSGTTSTWEQDLTTTVMSPNYPAASPTNVTQTWIYTKPGAAEVRAHISASRLAYGASVEFYDKNDNLIGGAWDDICYSMTAPGDTIKVVYNFTTTFPYYSEYEGSWIYYSSPVYFAIDRFESRVDTGMGYYQRQANEYQTIIDENVIDGQTYTYAPKIGGYESTTSYFLENRRYKEIYSYNPATITVNCSTMPAAPTNLSVNDTCPACGIRVITPHLSWDTVTGASRYKAQYYYRYKHWVDYDLATPGFPAETTGDTQIDWEISHPGAYAIELDLTSVQNAHEVYDYQYYQGVIFVDKEGYVVDSLARDLEYVIGSEAYQSYYHKLTLPIEGDTVYIQGDLDMGAGPAIFKIDGYYYYDYNPVGGEPAWIDIGTTTDTNIDAEIDVYKANGHQINYRVFSIDADDNYGTPATLTQTFTCSIPQSITYNPASMTLNNNGDTLAYQSLARCSLGETITIDESLNNLQETLSSGLNTCSTGTTINNKRIVSGSNASNCSGSLSGVTTKPFTFSSYRWPYPLNGQAPVQILGSFSPTDTNTDSTLNDAIVSPQVSSPTRHILRYDIRQSQIITDGSLKITFAPQFNLVGLNSSDIGITGGDVIWSSAIVNTIENTIVIPFSGSLDSSDDAVEISLGETNFINNPADLGDYPVYLTSHTSTDGSGDNVDYASDTISIIDASLNDVLSDSIAEEYSKHTIHYNITGDTDITDGSLKVALDPEFDFSSVTSTDIIVNGGGVDWGTPTVDTDQNTVVLPFTGTLVGGSNGLITIVIGNDHLVQNPANIDSYLVLLFGYESTDGSGDPVMMHQTRVAITGGVMVTASIPSLLTFTVSGVEADQSVNGSLTTIPTTNTSINFGVLEPNSSKVAAHDLLVEQNAADGFVVTVQQSHTLSSNNDTINNYSGSNTNPIEWTEPTEGQKGYWGYTTNDSMLSNGVQNRFISNKWAGLAAAPAEVMYHHGPTSGTNDINGQARVGYQIEITDLQSAGFYQTEIIYICTATY
ncbi:MAG: CUB domain-containing protein [Patescibacteria group bacterium]